MSIDLKDQTIADFGVHDRYPRDYTMPNYDNENPHPAFGKDPNIRNAQGHTEYPKYVTNKAGERVIVNNPAEEEEETGKGLVEEDDKPKPVNKKAAWGK